MFTLNVHNNIVLESEVILLKPEYHYMKNIRQGTKKLKIPRFAS
jgi:hypothetical protein